MESTPYTVQVQKYKSTVRTKVHSLRFCTKPVLNAVTSKQPSSRRHRVGVADSTLANPATHSNHDTTMILYSCTVLAY